MFRVLSAPIIRSTIKTVGAIMGTVHVSVWCRFKSVERRPRSGVYFTTSILIWPVLLRTKNVPDRSCRENQNTHFVFSNFFLSKIVPFME
jgi:hypothetical protein